MAGKATTQAKPKTFTPSELALELFGEADKVKGGKMIRSYLRSNHGRKLEVKGSRWEIPADVAQAVRDRFSKKQEEPKAKVKA